MEVMFRSPHILCAGTERYKASVTPSLKMNFTYLQITGGRYMMDASVLAALKLKQFEHMIVESHSDLHLGVLRRVVRARRQYPHGSAADPTSRASRKLSASER